jgi:FixJ family two-component response regulator
MSGWQVAEKVKSINGRVPVAIITGCNIEIEKSEMRDKWVDLVMQKPFEFYQVLNVGQEAQTP